MDGQSLHPFKNIFFNLKQGLDNALLLFQLLIVALRSVAYEHSIRGDGPWHWYNAKAIQEKAFRSMAAAQANMHHIIQNN